MNRLHFIARTKLKFESQFYLAGAVIGGFALGGQLYLILERAYIEGLSYYQ